MISLAFVNDEQESVLIDAFSYCQESFFDITKDIMDEFYREYENYKESVKYIEAELFVMEKVDDKKKKELDSKRQNFIQKIGQTIINLFNRFKEQTMKIIENIKGRVSGDTKKLEYLCKKDPSVAEKIKDMAKRGEITLKDMKDFKDLDKLYDDIMKSTEDPKTLKAKWRKAVDNLTQKKGTLIAIGVAATTIATIVQLPSIISKSNNEFVKNMKEKHKNMYEAYKTAKENYDAKYGEGAYDRDFQGLDLKLSVYQEMLGLTAAAIRENQTTLQKILSFCAKKASKLQSTKSKSNLTASLQYGADAINRENEEETQKELDLYNKKLEMNDNWSKEKEQRQNARQDAQTARREQREDEKEQRQNARQDAQTARREQREDEKEQRQNARQDAKEKLQNDNQYKNNYTAQYAKKQAEEDFKNYIYNSTPY